MSDEIKVGAYICKGCGLGERLDCGQLATIAEREGKANLVREHDFLCNAEGVAMIQNDIDNEGVNKVIIAACSRRSKNEAFNFENVAISRANLREGVIWVRPDDDESRETTQEMAADYVRMGCSEVKYMNLPNVNEEASSNDNLLVVGGGTGRTNARGDDQRLRSDHPAQAGQVSRRAHQAVTAAIPGQSGQALDAGGQVVRLFATSGQCFATFRQGHQGQFRGAGVETDDHRFRGP